MIEKTLLVAALITACSLIAQAQTPAAAAPNLLPAPASLRLREGRLPLTESFKLKLDGHRDARLQAGVERMLARLAARTGFDLTQAQTPVAAPPTLVIHCDAPGKDVPAVDEDESYSLAVSNTQATLSASTAVGVLRGLETWLQLLDGNRDVWFIPALVIEDKPRFLWRGLMIDIARHWQPPAVIKRNLDGMATVKLNVLHLHITDDQGFRIESKKYPKLHELGSDGHYYTQQQMREIIDYAHLRGIRVVPEFDLPGHTTAWFVGHPELASKPGPYEIERKWGIMHPVLDPTNEAVYALLDGFLGEMAVLFPDAFMHIGGDEVEGQHWQDNPQIQAFVKEKGLKDKHGLQAYFNARLLPILTRHGKRMIGWDEVLHPALPQNIVVQSWRGPQALAAAAKQGFTGILSNGYYIDLMHPARDHYLNDPVPENTTLTAEEQKLILGGEATMWSEWTSPETIDSRIWPRTAAIAERFWSPREVHDVDDMYRRLAIISPQLEEVGLLHEKNQPAMLRRLLGNRLAANESAGEMVKRIVDVLEPVKGYKRGTMQNATQQTPLTRLVDVARADSTRGRQLAALVDEALYDERPRVREAAALRINLLMNELLDAGDFVDASKTRGMTPLLAEAHYFALMLKLITKHAIDALELLKSDAAPPADWRAFRLSQLEAAARPQAALELVIVQPIKELVVAAAEKERRKTMTADEWKKLIKAAVAAGQKQ